MSQSRKNEKVGIPRSSVPNPVAESIIKWEFPRGSRVISHTAGVRVELGVIKLVERCALGVRKLWREQRTALVNAGATIKEHLKLCGTRVVGVLEELVEQLCARVCGR